MKELSLHILDIVQNSLGAKAMLIKIDLVEDLKKDLLLISIDDNGVGMDESVAKSVLDPFYTTRTTRKVGLGLPLLAQAAKGCGGDIDIQTKKGKGTIIKASFGLSHIDRAPIGSMSDTMVTLIALNPEVDFVYRHCIADKEFILDTRIIKNTLQEVPINYPSVLDWIKNYVEDGIKELNGGA